MNFKIRSPSICKDALDDIGLITSIGTIPIKIVVPILRSLRG